MTVIHPCDDISAEELTAQLLDLNGPSYMRTARNKVPRMYEDGSKVENRVWFSSQRRKRLSHYLMRGYGRCCNLCCRISLSEGISCTVVDMHTIKPLDVELVAKLSMSCGAFCIG